MFAPVPQYAFCKVTDIAADFIAGLGIKLLLLDLDNNIAAYPEHKLSDDVSYWISSLKAVGIKLFIISNSKRTDRVQTFAKELDSGYEMRAGKPSPNSIIKIMAAEGFNVSETALIGDQIYTDVLAANRAGIISIVVRPKQFSNPFLAIRYFFELPFRVMCKNKITGKKINVVKEQVNNE